MALTEGIERPEYATLERATALLGVAPGATLADVRLAYSRAIEGVTGDCGTLDDALSTVEHERFARLHATSFRDSAPTRRLSCLPALGVAVVTAAILGFGAFVAVRALSQPSFSDTSTRFSEPRSPVTFSYPRALAVQLAFRGDNVEFQATRGLGPNDYVNVSVSTLDLTFPSDGTATDGAAVVSARLVAARLDSAMARLVDQSAGTPSGSPQATQLGELPARAYGFISPSGTKVTVILALSGSTELRLICSSTARHEAEVSAGCGAVQQSVRFTSRATP